MKRLWASVLVLAASVVWALPVGSQPPGGQRQGPPDRGGPGGREGAPPRFEPGRILPPFARDQLKLTADQEKQIADLEKEVKTKLSKILSPDQMKQLQTLRPPGGRGRRGGPGGPGGGDGPPPGEGGPPPRPEPEDRPPGDTTAQAPTAGIQWFATLESGLREAQRTGGPILFLAAAPHCAGVSGIW